MGLFLVIGVAGRAITLALVGPRHLGRARGPGSWDPPGARRPGPCPGGGALPREVPDILAEDDARALAAKLAEGPLCVLHSEPITGSLKEHAVLLGGGLGEIEAGVEVGGVARDGGLQPADRAGDLVLVESRPAALGGLERPVDLAHRRAWNGLAVDNGPLVVDRVGGSSVELVAAGGRPCPAGQDGNGLADGKAT